VCVERIKAGARPAEAGLPRFAGMKEFREARAANKKAPEGAFLSCRARRELT
jgi:hypothetical protein